MFKPLPQKINEKPQVIADYECGRAIPNNQVMGKIERAIGKQSAVDLCYNILFLCPSVDLCTLYDPFLTIRAETAWEGYWPTPGGKTQEEMNTKPRNQPPPHSPNHPPPPKTFPLSLPLPGLISPVSCQRTWCSTALYLTLTSHQKKTLFWFYNQQAIECFVVVFSTKVEGLFLFIPA